MTGMVWYWLALSTLAATAAAYVACVWWQVRGIRGLALIVALLCLMVISSSFAGLHSEQSMVPVWLLAATERAVWWPMLLAVAVLADLYAADHNSHRALTTILYLRWERLRSRKG